MTRLYAEPRFAPLPGPKARDWQQIASLLAERPGEWAAVGEQETGRWPISKRQRQALGLEVSTRSNGDGTYTVWMRSIGQPDTPAPSFLPALDLSILAVTP